MKRINIKTGKPFKKGDIDENGRVFWKYITSKSLNKSGYFKESWCSSKEQFEKQKHVSLIYTIKNQKENKERYTQYRADRYASIEGRSKMLIASARQRAKVSITPTWVENKINNGFCEISGLPFDLSPTNKFFKNLFCIDSILLK